MTKYEFLNLLGDALQDNVLDETKNGQISYYNEYITNEINKGRSEEDVLSELGDPKLIAKTIIQVHPGEKKFSENAADIRKNSRTANSEDNYDNVDSDTSYDNSDNNNYYENNNNNFGRVYSFGPWGCLITLIIITLILTIILRLIFGAGALMFNGINFTFGPVLGPIVIFAIIYYLLFRKRG